MKNLILIELKRLFILERKSQDYGQLIEIYNQCEDLIYQRLYLKKFFENKEEYAEIMGTYEAILEDINMKLRNMNEPLLDGFED